MTKSRSRRLCYVVSLEARHTSHGDCTNIVLSYFSLVSVDVETPNVVTESRFLFLSCVRGKRDGTRQTPCPRPSRTWRRDWKHCLIRGCDENWRWRPTRWSFGLREWQDLVGLWVQRHGSARRLSRVEPTSRPRRRHRRWSRSHEHLPSVSTTSHSGKYETTVLAILASYNLYCGYTRNWVQMTCNIFFL